RLAAMARIPVDVFEQRQKVFAEHLVVVGAAEPAAVAEIDELDAAMGTFGAAKDRLIRLDATFGFAGRDRRGILHVLLGTILTEVKFLELPLPQHLGDVQSRGIRTLHALVHGSLILTFAFAKSTLCILTGGQGVSRNGQNAACQAMEPRIS